MYTLEGVDPLPYVHTYVNTCTCNLSQNCKGGYVSGVYTYKGTHILALSSGHSQFFNVTCRNTGSCLVTELHISRADTCTHSIMQSHKHACIHTTFIDHHCHATPSYPV